MADLFVPSGGNLDAAIDTIDGGDNIVLAAGGEYHGNFAFSDRGFDAAHQVTVKTNATLPNRRVGIADVSLMPKLIPVVSGGQTPPPLSFLTRSKWWNFLGVEVVTAPGQPYCNVLVDIAPYVEWADVPSDLSFDRCYVHSLEDGTDNPHATSRIGFNAVARNLAITRSRISFPAGYVMDSQTVDNQYPVLCTMAENVTIDDNFLGSWYNGFFTGGASLPTNNRATVISAAMDRAVLSNVNNLQVGDLIAFQQSDSYYGAAKVIAIESGNLVRFVPYATSWGAEGTPLTQVPLTPGDAQWRGLLPNNFTIRKNQFHINPQIAQRIYSETQAFPKGYFEIKALVNALFEGNDFTGQQSNWAFTVRNQGTPHGAPSVWSTIRNITMRSNRLIGFPFSSYRHIILALEDNYGTSTRGGDILLENNLCTGMGTMGDVSDGDNIVYRHNTFKDDYGPSMIVNIGRPAQVKLFDNIMANNEYGTHCQENNFDCFIDLFNGNMTGNVIVGAAQPYRPTCGNPYPVPANACAPDYNAVGFVDAASGNYRLRNDSVYKGFGSGGSDPGIDQDALEAALSGDTPIQYLLYVVSGSGAGYYNSGTVVAISADARPGYVFDHWEGAVANPASANTTATVVGNMTVTAIYTPVSPPTTTYHLTVDRGTGDGDYAMGSVVPIVADAPDPGMRFDHWQGTVASATSANTTATVNSDMTVTAIYVALPPAVVYHHLTVDHGSGDGDYAEGSVVPVLAAVPDPGMRFDHWEGPVASALSASTTVVVNTDTTVTAVYTLTPSATVFHLAVIDGLGEGDYENGSIVPIVADDPPEGMIFWRWEETTLFPGPSVIVDPASASTMIVLTGDATVRAVFVEFREDTAMPEQNFALRHYTPDESAFLAAPYPINCNKVVITNDNAPGGIAVRVATDPNNASAYKVVQAGDSIEIGTHGQAGATTLFYAGSIEIYLKSDAPGISQVTIVFTR
jgi:uncharacterized repeat protein (TIGR02543 family)